MLNGDINFIVQGGEENIKDLTSIKKFLVLNQLVLDI